MAPVTTAKASSAGSSHVLHPILCQSVLALACIPFTRRVLGRMWMRSLLLHAINSPGLDYAGFCYLYVLQSKSARPPFAALAPSC